jgi:hypothetical protein
MQILSVTNGGIGGIGYFNLELPKGINATWGFT